MALESSSGQFGDLAGEELPELDDDTKVEVLDLLIRVELVTQEAYRLGFAPSEEELDSLAAQAMENYGGREALEAALIESGDSLATFRAQVARNEAILAWRDTAFLARATVSEEEARAFYDEHQEEVAHGPEVRAIHIMFPMPLESTGDESRAAIRAKADEALTLAHSGMDFEELMYAYMDPNTLNVTANGNLGWVSKGSSLPDLEEAIFSLEPGQISDIVETPFSLHIIKVLETRPAGTISFEELRPSIVEALFEDKIDTLVQARVEELIANAQVEIEDPVLAALWKAAKGISDPNEPASPDGTGQAQEPGQAEEAGDSGDSSAEEAEGLWGF
jgi:peptidyl-prolyl cis-trans isomerase C